MTCPECGGKGYVELFISSQPCSLCGPGAKTRGEGPKVDEGEPETLADMLAKVVTVPPGGLVRVANSTTFRPETVTREELLSAFRSEARRMSSEQLEQRIHDLAQTVEPLPTPDDLVVGDTVTVPPGGLVWVGCSGELENDWYPRAPKPAGRTVLTATPNETAIGFEWARPEPAPLRTGREVYGDALTEAELRPRRRWPDPTPDWSSPELAALKPAESFAHPAEVRDRVQSWSRRLAEVDTSTDAVFMRKNAEVGEWRPVYDRHCPPGKRVEQRAEGSQVGFRLVDAHPNEEWVDCEGYMGVPLAVGSIVVQGGRRGKVIAHDPDRFRDLVRWEADEG